MAYNRWINNELEHHQVKGAHWGVHNGPPYPLDRSLSDGNKLLPKATGSPQTKKKYKTSEKTAYQRKKRQEKIESSPDYQEKHSTTAEIKRGYRALKKKYGEYRQKRDEERQKMKERREQEQKKQDKAREDAVKRLNDTNMSDEEKQKLIDDAWTSDRFDADKLNKALDEYAKEPARAKEHGTIDEVLKFRDQYSKEDWDSITSRLEAESKVHKLKETATNAVTPPADKKIRKIYEKGTAREVYQNRDKFTVGQLEAIEKRLTAEEKIGKLANNQVFISPDRVKKLEQVRDVLKIFGDMANTANAISKAFGGSGGDGGKNNNNNKNKGNDSGESKRTTVVVEETKKDGTVKKTTTTDSTDKGPTAWLDKRKKKE